MSDRPATGLNRSHGPWLAGAFAAVLIAGALFVWWTVTRTDHQMRADLLLQARLVAQAVDVGQVKALSGTEADRDSPGYQRLKEQFMSVGSVQPNCKWLYLMGRKADGTVFFQVDSESPYVEDPTPPGEVYEDVPAGYRRAFDTRADVVEGPVTDRWGTWVTALVPLTDPQGGAVVAVLGMDIDARTWKWDVATQAALPLGLMLVLFIGMATAFLSTRRVAASPRPVLRRLLPSLAAVVIAVIAGGGALLWHEHRLQLAETIAGRASRVSNDLRAALDQRSAGLAAAAQTIAADAEVRRALSEGDAGRLLAAWQPVFETLGPEHSLTYCYFYDKNLMPLLRVHMPGISGGGRNERFTAREAERTGKAASGIELGTLGTFTLRVVQPVLEGGRLTGYVELSREVKDVVRSLPVPSGAQLAVVIRKASLNEQAREASVLTQAGCRSCHSREADWDRLPRSVVIYSSQGRLPDAFAAWADRLAAPHSHGEIDRDIASGGSTWRASASPLNDASGKEVGDLLFMSDVTADKAAFARLLALGGTAGAVLLALLLGFIYVLLRRTDAGIRAQQAALRESEETFRVHVENSFDVIFTLSSDGVFVFLSPAWERQFGYPISDAIGKPFAPFVHPEDVAPLFEYLKRVLATGQGETSPAYRVRHANGGWVWIVANGTPYVSTNGERQFIGVGRDITERKRVEEDRETALSRLQRISSRVPGMVYEFRLRPDGTSCMPYASESIREIYQVSQEEVREDASIIFTRHHPGDNDGIVASIQRSARDLTPWRHEYRILCADGTVRWVFGNSLPEREADGSTLWHGFVTDITERKKIGEALAKSEAQLFEMATQVPGVVYQFYARPNGEMGFYYVSDRSEQILGLEPDVEGYLERIVALIVPEHRKGFIESIEKSVKESSGWKYEWMLQKPTGEKIWCSGDSTPSPRADEMVFNGIVTDITERRRVEGELREAKALTDAVVESVPLMIFLKEATDLRFVLFNRAGEELLGYDRTALLGKSNLDLFPPEQAAHFMANDREVLDAEAGMLDIPEEAILTAKKGQRLLHTRKVCIRGGDGTTKFLLGISEDITERKRAEEALRRSTDQVGQLLQSTDQCIYGIDLAGGCTFINDSGLRTLGFSLEECVGRSMHDLIHHSHADGSSYPVEECPIFRAKVTGVGVRVDSEVLWRKDGTSFPAEYSAYPTSEEGTIRGAVVSFFDITERKRAEEVLLETNRHLEEATIRANELAEQAGMASIAKSEFLANMSHEIRTPMNGVIGMTGLLLDTELNDEQRRFTEIVRASGESLLGLINDILDFSKIEARKLDLETLDFDLSNLLDDFAVTLAVRAHEKGLELLCAADPAVPTLLRGDPGRLRQVLTNLSGNAVKFTHQGEIAVRASLVSETDADAVIRFSIRDTGIGIPAEKRELLFQKFSQVDASTTRQYGGTGLGLAISKQLAELMGGEVGVESEAGKGSEFWFTARLVKQAAGVQAENLPPADLREVRALIVDDNATSREILTTRLASWGMRPSEVQDGAGALRALYRALEENDPFRIAVIDMQMPGMDGETVGRTIRADERLADLRMVMLTSLGARGDARRFQDLGFAAYATKPIRYEELKTVLSLALTERPGAEPASRPIVTRHSAREALNLFAGRKVRILLAEDNITNQQVALGILTKLGLRADAVANGAEALRALEALPYDLVLMDVQMPEMDGIEATHRIRDPQSAVPNHAIPIIAMTAHAMQGDRERCIVAGMNDYVAKPVSPRLLAEALDKWLPQGSAAITDRVPVAPAVTAALPAQESSVPVFDRAGMMTRLMNDDDLAKQIVDEFLKDIPQQITALRGCLEAGDAKGVTRQAHTIKGAAATVGGERLRDVAFDMEKAGKAGDLSAAAGHLAGLDAQFDRLKQALTEGL